MRGNAYYISLERQIWKKLQHGYYRSSISLREDTIFFSIRKCCFNKFSKTLFKEKPRLFQEPQPPSVLLDRQG